MELTDICLHFLDHLSHLGHFLVLLVLILLFVSLAVTVDGVIRRAFLIQRIFIRVLFHSVVRDRSAGSESS